MRIEIFWQLTDGSDFTGLCSVYMTMFLIQVQVVLYEKL